MHVFSILWHDFKSFLFHYCFYSGNMATKIRFLHKTEIFLVCVCVPQLMLDDNSINSLLVNMAADETI